MAVCAPWSRSDGHAPAGVTNQAKLTLETDHSMGTDQLAQEPVAVEAVEAVQLADGNVRRRQRNRFKRRWLCGNLQAATNQVEAAQTGSIGALGCP